MPEPKKSVPVPECLQNLVEKINTPLTEGQELRIISFFQELANTAQTNDAALALLHFIAVDANGKLAYFAEHQPERLANIVQHFENLPANFSASPKAVHGLVERHKTLRVGTKCFSAIQPAVANSRKGQPLAEYLIKAAEKIQSVRMARAEFFAKPDAVACLNDEILAAMKEKGLAEANWIDLPDLQPETAEKWFVAVWDMVLGESNGEPQNHPLVKGKLPRQTVEAGSKSQGSTFKDDMKRIFVRMVESKKG